MTDIAKQYAIAVFSLASEKNKIQDFSDELHSFVTSLDEKTEKFFHHPKLTKLNKKEVIENVVKDKLLADFLKVIIDNDRFDLLSSIDLAYQDLVNEMNKVMTVKIHTNKKLTKENIAKIKKKISDKYQKQVLIEEILDQTIIGGIKIEYEGKVIDNTVNKYLQNLKAALKD